ncbi:MAG: hypothetical protein E7406_07785 [Ruminococcaceae bacterium]|nr:hypothetical protein [Oscillospiraceae bacterium]
MRYIGRRIYETLAYHIFVSVVVALLFYFNYLEPGYKLSVCMLGLTALFDIVTISFFTSIYYKYTEEDNKTFYKTNLLAISLLVVPAILFAFIDSAISLEPVYTFLFFPFKLGMIAFGMSKLVSAFVFSIILLTVAVIIPLFLRKVIPEQEEMPPMMDTENNSDNEKKVSE